VIIKPQLIFAPSPKMAMQYFNPYRIYKKLIINFLAKKNKIKLKKYCSILIYFLMIFNEHVSSDVLLNFFNPVSLTSKIFFFPIYLIIIKSIQLEKSIPKFT